MKSNKRKKPQKCTHKCVHRPAGVPTHQGDISFNHTGSLLSQKLYYLKSFDHYIHEIHSRHWYFSATAHSRIAAPKCRARHFRRLQLHVITQTSENVHSCLHGKHFPKPQHTTENPFGLPAFIPNVRGMRVCHNRRCISFSPRGNLPMVLLEQHLYGIAVVHGLGGSMALCPMGPQKPLLW